MASRNSSGLGGSTAAAVDPPRGEGVEPWSLTRQKNRVVVGTWDEGRAFQLSLRRAGQGGGEDPLSVPLFHELLPYHCLPHCGVYSPDDYHLAAPLVVIALPSELVTGRGKLFSELPPKLQQTLIDKAVIDPSKLEVAVLMHSRPHLEGSLDPAACEVNLMMHMWALQGVNIADEEVHTTVDMGVFGPEGVCQTAQDVCEELNGVAVGRIGRRILYMHALSFSPHNAQLKLLDKFTIHSFFSFGYHGDSRSVIAYHIIPSTKEAEGWMTEAVRLSDTAGQLLGNLKEFAGKCPGMDMGLSTLRRLLLAVT